LIIMTEDFASFEQERDGYTLSTDRARLDAGALPVVIYTADGQLAAFGRVVTDYAVFAYLRDVFTLPAHRRKGLATWIATAIREHPELATVSTWMLATRDAHAVYERAGFRPVPHPEYYMSIPKPDDSL
jgi:GNAT superfamily N-acetyltransferase